MDSTKGFTLVEVIVAATAGALVSLTLLSISLFFFSDIMRAQIETDMLVESQRILRQVAEDVRTGSEILTTNTVADVNEPGPGWSTSNADLILIIADPSLNTSRQFINDPLNDEPYKDNIIYFASDTTLYKRLLANQFATDNRSSTSCPPALVTASCPSDSNLSQDFKDMSFEFYDQNGDLTADPTLGRSVEITIDLEKKAYGKVIHIENNIRMTLRNPGL